MNPSAYEEKVEAFIARLLDDSSPGHQRAMDALSREPESLQALVRRRLGTLRQVGMLEELQGLRPGTRFGSLTVRGRLGEGGMGTVYEAWDDGLGRRVALKLIRDLPLASPAARERFSRESQALAQLNHPSIVTIHSADTEARVPFLVMECVEGTPLTRWIPPEPSRLSTTAVQERIALVAQVARALAVVHQQGIVHRDVKPDNIMVREDGTPVLLDFGLVRASGKDTLTSKGEALGTLAYAAPEQARATEVDERADVWGCTATLYHLLTGRPPRDAEGIVQLVEISQTAPPLASEANASLPRELVTILAKGLQPSPDDRYASCCDLADDLDAFLDGRPISARRSGVVQRTWKWARRNRALAAVLVLAPIALGLALLVQVRERARADAEEYVRLVTEGSDALVGDTGDPRDRDANRARRREAVAAFTNAVRLDGRPLGRIRLAEAHNRLGERNEALAALTPVPETHRGFAWQQQHAIASRSKDRPKLVRDFEPEARDLSPIDRAAMAWIWRQKNELRLAYELVSDPTLIEDGMLGIEILVAGILFEDLMSNPQPTIFREGGSQMRLALQITESHLKRRPKAANAGHLKLLILTQARHRGLDLPPWAEHVDWAEGFFSWANGSWPDDELRSLEVTFWFIMARAKSPRSLEFLGRARRASEGLPAGPLPGVDGFEFQFVALTHIFNDEFDTARDRLRTRLVVPTAVGPATSMVELHNTFLGASPGLPSHRQALEDYLRSPVPTAPWNEEDLRTALSQLKPD